MSKPDNPVAQKRRLALKTLTGSALIGGVADKLPGVWQRPLVHSAALPSHAQISPLENRPRGVSNLPTIQLQVLDNLNQVLGTLAVPYQVQRNADGTISLITFQASQVVFNAPGLINALFPAAYAQTPATTQPPTIVLPNDVELRFSGSSLIASTNLVLSHMMEVCDLPIEAELQPNRRNLRRLSANTANAVCSGNLSVRPAQDEDGNELPGFFALPTPRPGQMMNLRLAVFNPQSQQPMSQPLELPVMAEMDSSGEITKIMFDGTGVMSYNREGEPQGLMERLFPAAYAQEFVTDLQLDGQSVNIHGLEIVFGPESHRATGVLHLAWNNGTQVCTLVIEATLSEDRTRLYSLAIVERFNCGNGEIRPVNEADQPVADVVISTELDERPPRAEQRIRVAAFIADRIASTPLTLTYQTLFAPDGRIVNIHIERESAVGGGGFSSLELVTDEIFWNFEGFDPANPDTHSQVVPRVGFIYAGGGSLRLFHFTAVLNQDGKSINRFEIASDLPSPSVVVRLLDLSDAEFAVINPPPPVDPDRVIRLLLIAPDGEVEGEELIINYAPVRDAAGRITIMEFWVDNERQPHPNENRQYTLNLLSPEDQRVNPIQSFAIRHTVWPGTDHHTGIGLQGHVVLFYSREGNRVTGEFQFGVDLTPTRTEITGMNYTGRAFQNGELVLLAFHDEGYIGLPAPPESINQLDLLVRDRSTGHQISRRLEIPLDNIEYGNIDLIQREADGTIANMAIWVTYDPNSYAGGGGPQQPPADNVFADLYVAQVARFSFRGSRSAHAHVLMRYGYRTFYVSMGIILSTDRMRVRGFQFDNTADIRVTGDYGGIHSDGSNEIYVDFANESDQGPVDIGVSNDTLTVGFAQGLLEADEGGAVVDVNVSITRNEAQTAPVTVRIKSQNDTNVGLAGYRVLDAAGNVIDPPADPDSPIGDNELRVEEQYGVLRNFAFVVPARPDTVTLTRTIRLQVPRNDVAEDLAQVIELEIVPPSSDRVGYTVDDNAAAVTINIRDRSTTLFAIPIADRTFNWRWEGGEGFAAQGTFTVKSDAAAHMDENAEVVIRATDLSRHVLWMTEGDTLLYVLDIKPGESMGELTTYNYGGGFNGPITPVNAPAGFIQQAVHVAHEFEYTPGRGHFNALSGPIGSSLSIRTDPQNLPRGRTISGRFNGAEFERGALLYGLFGVSQNRPGMQSLDPKGGSQSVSEGPPLTVPSLHEFTYRWHSHTYVVEGTFRSAVLDNRLTNQNGLSMHTIRVLHDGNVYVWANLATREVVARQPNGTYQESTLSITQAIQYRIGDDRFGNFNLSIPGILSFTNAEGFWDLHTLGVRTQSRFSPQVSAGDGSAITAKPDLNTPASVQTRTMFYYWAGDLRISEFIVDRIHVRGELEYTAEDGHLLDSSNANFSDHVTKHIFSASFEESFIGRGPDDTKNDAPFLWADLSGDTWEIIFSDPRFPGAAGSEHRTLNAALRNEDDYRIGFVPSHNGFNGDFRINFGVEARGMVFENRADRSQGRWVFDATQFDPSYRVYQPFGAPFFTENPTYAPMRVPTAEFGLVVRFDDQDPNAPSILREDNQEHTYIVWVERNGAQTSSIPFKIRIGSGTTAASSDFTIKGPDGNGNEISISNVGDTLQFTAGFQLDEDPNNGGQDLIAGGDEIHYYTVQVHTDTDKELDEIIQLEFVTEDFPPTIRTSHPDRRELTIQADTFHAYRWSHIVNDVRNHRHGQPLVSYRVEGEFRTRSGKTVLQETDVYGHTLRVSRGVYNQPESYTDFVYAINFFGNEAGTEGILIGANGSESRYPVTQDFEYDTTTGKFNLGGRTGIESQGFPVTLSLSHDLAGLIYVRAGEIDVWQLFDGSGRELGRVQFMPPAGFLVGDNPEDPFPLYLRGEFARAEYEVNEEDEVTVTINFTRIGEQEYPIAISVSADTNASTASEGVDYTIKDLRPNVGEFDFDQNSGDASISGEFILFNLPTEATSVSFVLDTHEDADSLLDKTIVMEIDLSDVGIEANAFLGYNATTTVTILNQTSHEYQWSADLTSANQTRYRVEGMFYTRSTKMVLQEGDVHRHMMTVSRSGTELYSIEFLGGQANGILRRPDGTEISLPATHDFEFDIAGSRFNWNNPNTEVGGVPVRLSLGHNQYGLILQRAEEFHWLLYDNGTTLVNQVAYDTNIGDPLTILPVGVTLAPETPKPTTVEPTRVGFEKTADTVIEGNDLTIVVSKTGPEPVTVQVNRVDAQSTVAAGEVTLATGGSSGSSFSISIPASASSASETLSFGENAVGTQRQPKTQTYQLSVTSGDADIHTGTIVITIQPTPLQTIGWRSDSITVVTEPTGGVPNYQQFAGRSIRVTRTGSGAAADVVFSVTNTGGATSFATEPFHRGRDDDSDFAINHDTAFAANQLITNNDQTLTGGNTITGIRTQEGNNHIYAFSKNGIGFSLALYRDQVHPEPSGEGAIFTLIDQPDYIVDDARRTLTVTFVSTADPNAPAPSAPTATTTAGPNDPDATTPLAPIVVEFSQSTYSGTAGEATDVVIRRVAGSSMSRVRFEYIYAQAVNANFAPGDLVIGLAGVTINSSNGRFAGLEIAEGEDSVTLPITAPSAGMVRIWLVENFGSDSNNIVADSGVPAGLVDNKHSVKTEITYAAVVVPPETSETDGGGAPADPLTMPVVVEFAETAYTTNRGDTTEVVIRRTDDSGTAKVTISSISITGVQFLEADDFTISGATKNGVTGIDNIEIPKEQASVTISIAWEHDPVEQRPGSLTLQLQSASITAEGGVEAAAGNNSSTQITVNPVAGGRPEPETPF